MNEEEIREMQEEAEEREKARQERGGATDEQLTQALKELQNPKDPRREEKFLEERAKRKKAEEEGDDPNIAGTAGGLGFEVAAGVATDKATAFLLNPLLGPKGIALYGLANFASGAVANAIAQRMRGDKNFSLGEILASGAAGIIPGTTAKLGKKGSKILGKANTIKRAAIACGLTGVGSEQIRIGIDEKRPLTFNEAALAGAVGGTASASLQRIARGASNIANDYYQRLQDNAMPVLAMSPQKVATPGNIQQPKNTVISPFTGRALKQQKIGPYPSLPVNSRVIKVNTVEDAKDFVISRATNRKRKTIRTRGQKGPEIFEVTGGEQVMFDVDLRGESYISRRDQLITVPAVDVAQNSRYVLEQIPEDLEYYIRNVYDDEVFEQYARYVKAGRNRLNVIKQEMQEEIKSIRADLIDLEAGAIGRPNLIAPTQAKLEDSHILSVGRKGKLVRTGLTPGVQRVLQKSKVNRRSPSTFYGNMTKNFPSESRVYEPPAAYQSFIEFWKDNRARGAGSAFEGKDLQEAVDELRELGLPTSWLEDFFNFAIFDNLIASELNNKDIVKLLKQGYSAEAIFQQRLKKLNREMQLLDIYDFQDSIRDLPVSEQVKLIDERYRKEILAGTNIAVFLDPPEKVPGTE